MTENAIAAVTCIFRESWRLFTSWHIPGTNVSPAAWLVFALVFFIGLKMVFGILGMTSVFGSYGFMDEAERKRKDAAARERAFEAAKRDSYLMPEVGASGTIYYPKSNGKW